ncbi:MAG: hypothetical protein AAFU85_16380 [Planctomycetota bacterium]
MKMGRLLSLVVLSVLMWVCGSRCFGDGKENPTTPGGMVSQELALGGSIPRPKDWKYESREIGKTISQKLWEPIPGNDRLFETSLTIDVVTNVRETGKQPSEFAEEYLNRLEQKGTVVRRYEPSERDGKIQVSAVIDQNLKITSVEKLYRVRYILESHEKTGLLFVISVGSPKNEWEKRLPTFKAMVAGLTLVDLSKARAAKPSEID